MLTDECWLAWTQVKASSPLCRYTDARAMAGSKLVRSNLAGPQHVPGSSSHTSWWLLDLGPHHRLACNYYSLRHDASNAFLRSWVLQVCHTLCLLSSSFSCSGALS